MPSVDNLTMGVGYLYIAEFGATEPDDDSVHTEPESATWSNLGYTKEGVTLSIEQEYQELEVDQLADVPGSRLIKRVMTISTSLAETTLENFQRVLNGDGAITEDASTAGVDASGADTFEPGNALASSAPTYSALLFDGVAPNGMVRRIIARRCLQVGAFESQYTKDGELVYPVEFKLHYVSPSIRPYKIVDQTAAPTPA